LFSIYSFASAFIIAEDDSANKYRKSIKTENNSELIETERRLFMEENRDLYTASRGQADRSSENGQTDQIVNQQAAEAAAKPAETAAVKPAQESVKPAPKPAPAPAKPAPAAKAEPAKADSGYAYNLDLLARLITAEAQAEPYEAKVAVGAVVMNRVQSGSWPNTIKDVIYQNINGYYQFTPVVNGWINKPAEPGSIEAAKAALNGSDPTNGAEFYYDDTTTNEWILSKPVSTKIGHMIFAF
jgi:spore germination cell wall hydrolase CwlJ-like protein